MSSVRQFDVVTGAFGYTGKYIARRLLRAGRTVRTLTAHPERENPFGTEVEIAAMDFNQPETLVQSLQGAAVLFNTYWVRFNRGRTTFDQAISNSRILIQAAKRAGIRKIVHVSIANPSVDSSLPYYSGKAEVEKQIIDSGLSYSILRPTVIFGPEGILINNIAWFVRHFPIFVIPGSGEYQVQPIFVEDIAELALDCALQHDNSILDAVGPEIFTFERLIRVIASETHRRTKLVHVPPEIALLMLRLLGPLVGDIILTREEIEGLKADLLASKKPATGQTRFSDWLAQNAPFLGTTYTSELERHYR